MEYYGIYQDALETALKKREIVIYTRKWNINRQER